MKKSFVIFLLIVSSFAVSGTEQIGNDLSYDYYVTSNKPIKCLYGYFADKTGDHETTIRIFEDCIKRWNSVYSMISLAQIYEIGVAVERDLEYATALMKRGAKTNDEAGYSSLARYHYGVALFEGKVINRINKPALCGWKNQCLRAL